MDRQKAISILKAKVQCEENQIAGAACKNHKECYECDLCYAQGKWGEQVECLKMAIEALQTEPIEVEAAKLQKAYDDGVRSGRNEFFNFDSPLVKTGEAISRQAVLDIGYANAWRTPEELRIYDLVEKLQSVKPEQKVGRWLEKDGYDGDVYYDCSACGNSWTTIDGTPWDNGMNFCPNCGAKMEEGE